MNIAQILIDGTWRAAESASAFQAANPATGAILPARFPVSEWSDCEIALAAATHAARLMRDLNSDQLANFLEAYAAKIEASAERIVEATHLETGLPMTPRLKDVELPRTTDQLRQAASAAREESWKRATIDSARNIRSSYAPIGPVIVFGPNNFPLAFNGISGGDFAAAIAAGNPVIAKAHPLHPYTSQLLAEQAHTAALETGLPAGSVQMIYALSSDDGLRLVSDGRVGATAFTGSRAAGLRLKRAADEAGKPIYLEMSSLNPVIFLPGALAERAVELARELADSCLAGAGQFCTSPNLVLVWGEPGAQLCIAELVRQFESRAAQPLLSLSGQHHLTAGVAALIEGGAELLTGGVAMDQAGFRYANTLLHATGKQFLLAPEALQREVFGNATLAVTVAGLEEMEAILDLLEGNLTGTIYSSRSGEDDAIYARIEPLLRRNVGRLLNDKMPTGVAVSPAMQHGGPFPATSHPGFTSVGIPASLTRFAKLECYDGVREDRLPSILRASNGNPRAWRLVDGEWRKG